MSNAGEYCKAYPVERLRGYTKWEEPKGSEPLPDGECVFIHDDYVVTRGIYRDEQVLFDRVTDEWRAFCRDSLAFEVPDFG